ncbi:unnamed protein product (macronuclear) [Paramecium tetraurelia]|uniref:Uncharacterized protein n=1 Tax=Paramecium tetraurelia TaxID=5888 RepID=A0C2H9_PARTE|nr:uncharacterized protein GSPATT00034474001 [Paramecium tetraurelia]CAK64996.1 unnamed protein product [Paramecium tetraurelia]|eukprot:XP_001432393.1 hypothetical protein (macronuclear) [Paramecium tetraurelia strain d4-2]
MEYRIAIVYDNIRRIKYAYKRDIIIRKQYRKLQFYLRSIALAIRRLKYWQLSEEVIVDCRYLRNTQEEFYNDGDGTKWEG